MALPAGIPSDDIDTLLERYLGLLDEYIKLRSTLTALQASVYQSIARANFSAEHGIRYGRDLYDERMQRSRTLAITRREDGTPTFEVTSCGREIKDSQDEENQVTASEADADEKRDSPQKPSDPLRWFGILTPLSLRHAQSQSIRAVEQVIPRLVTVDAEMADVEIRVRRARKRRAKAQAQAAKDRAEDGQRAVAEAIVVVASHAATAEEQPAAPDDEKIAPTEEDAAAGSN